MKITMYDLLGLVKDGKAPKKIKYKDKIYYYHKGYDFNYMYNSSISSPMVKVNSLFTFVSYKLKDGRQYFDDNTAIDFLNDEVEILEEPIISKLYINNELQYDLEEKKIPEKSKIDFNTKLPVSGCSENEAFMMTCISHLGNTMDKIIDYLDYFKSKGDE